MTDTTSTQPNLASVAAQSAIDTAKALAPAIITAGVAAAAVSNPSTAATALALAPVAMQFLNNAMILAQAGTLSESDLASLWATIGQGIAANQAQWNSMNGPTAVAASNTDTKPAA
jgi:hypothetical protein